MAKQKALIPVVLLITLLLGTPAHGDLKALMKLGKSQAEISKSLQEESKNYKRVKDAIISEELKEGMPAAGIREKYGEPIIDVFDNKKNAYKWLYMPATSTHFKGEKLYLFVSEEGKLVGWKLIEE